MLYVYIGAAVAFALLALAAAGVIGYLVGRESVYRMPIQNLFPRLENEWQACVADFRTHNDFAKAQPFIIWMHRRLEPLHRFGFFEKAYGKMPEYGGFGEEATVPCTGYIRPTLN